MALNISRRNISMTKIPGSHTYGFCIAVSLVDPSITLLRWDDRSPNLHETTVFFNKRHNGYRVRRSHIGDWFPTSKQGVHWN